MAPSSKAELRANNDLEELEEVRVPTNANNVAIARRTLMGNIIASKALNETTANKSLQKVSKSSEDRGTNVMATFCYTRNTKRGMIPER